MIGNDDKAMLEASGVTPYLPAEVVTSVMAAALLPACELSTPLVVDTGIGDNWEQAH